MRDAAPAPTDPRFVDAEVGSGMLRNHIERVEEQLIRDAMEWLHGNKTLVGLRMLLEKLGFTKPYNVGDGVRPDRAPRCGA